MTDGIKCKAACDEALITVADLGRVVRGVCVRDPATAEARGAGDS